MRTFLLERKQFLPRAIGDVFQFFSRPENLQVITPPWLDFRMVDAPGDLSAGSLISYRLRWRHIPIRWTTEISDWNPPYSFTDRELSGPYVLWNHEHQFSPENSGTWMHDRVTYALPLGWIGSLVHRAVVRRDVESIFDFRAETMQKLFGK